MIDVQAELYTIGREAILTQYPKTEVSSTYTLQPTKFPFVSIIEGDNAVYKATSDSARLENHASIMIEVNIYTTGDSKQSLARGIMAALDSKYSGLGLERIMMNPITNYNDTTVYRIVARYRGIISTNKQIYRR